MLVVVKLVMVGGCQQPLGEGMLQVQVIELKKRAD